MKSWLSWDHWRKQDWKTKTAVATFLCVAIALALFLDLRSSWRSEEVQEEVQEIDTIIPKGFVLVPIEIQNREPLEALVQNFAVVDLHTLSNTAERVGEIVATRVRLLRAKQNPREFAVLIPEQSAKDVLRHQGKFWVVLKNRNEGETEVPIKQREVSRLKYY